MSETCRNGHPWEANAYEYRGRRYCRSCKTEASRASKLKPGYKPSLPRPPIVEVKIQTCECGARKLYGRSGCERCVFLDGIGHRAHDAISYLGDGPATAPHIAAGLGYPDGKRGSDSVALLLKRLISRGRVRRTRNELGEIWYELTGGEVHFDGRCVGAGEYNSTGEGNRRL